MANEDAGGRSSGVLDSLRNILRTLLAIAHTRLELLGTEFREEIARLGLMLLWGYVALFFVTLGGLLLVGALILALWEAHRILAFSVLGAIFLILGAAAAWAMLRVAHRKPRMFEASLDELERDHAGLTRKP